MRKTRIWAPNPAGGYAGEYVLSGAQVSFSFTSQVSATDTTPFTFTTDPGGQRVLFAQVAHEVTGMFVRWDPPFSPADLAGRTREARRAPAR